MRLVIGRTRTDGTARASAYKRWSFLKWSANGRGTSTAPQRKSFDYSPCAIVRRSVPPSYGGGRRGTRGNGTRSARPRGGPRPTARILTSGPSAACAEAKTHSVARGPGPPPPAGRAFTSIMRGTQGTTSSITAGPLSGAIGRLETFIAFRPEPLAPAGGPGPSAFVEALVAGLRGAPSRAQRKRRQGVTPLGGPLSYEGLAPSALAATVAPLGPTSSPGRTGIVAAEGTGLGGAAIAMSAMKRRRFMPSPSAGGGPKEGGAGRVGPSITPMRGAKAPFIGEGAMAACLVGALTRAEGRAEGAPTVPSTPRPARLTRTPIAPGRIGTEEGGEVGPPRRTWCGPRTAPARPTGVLVRSVPFQAVGPKSAITRAGIGG